MEDQSSKKVPLLYSLLFGLKKEVYEPMSNSIPMSMPMSSGNNFVINNNPSLNENINNNSQLKNPYNMNNSSVSNNNNSNMNVPNKFKEQSINIKNMSADQPKPWIID